MKEKLRFPYFRILLFAALIFCNGLLNELNAQSIADYKQLELAHSLFVSGDLKSSLKLYETTKVEDRYWSYELIFLAASCLMTHDTINFEKTIDRFNNFHSIAFNFGMVNKAKSIPLSIQKFILKTIKSRYQFSTYADSINFELYNSINELIGIDQFIRLNKLPGCSLSLIDSSLLFNKLALILSKEFKASEIGEANISLFVVLLHQTYHTSKFDLIIKFDILDKLLHKNILDYHHYAMLIDSYLEWKGEKSIYGTYFINGRDSIGTLDLSAINLNRSKIGLLDIELDYRNALIDTSKVHTFYQDILRRKE